MLRRVVPERRSGTAGWIRSCCRDAEIVAQLLQLPAGCQEPAGHSWSVAQALRAVPAASQAQQSSIPRVVTARTVMVTK